MALSGDLREFQLSELLQILSMGKKTGVLAIQGDVAQGLLRLAGGRLLDAEAGDLAGEPAFFLLARNHAGPFVFSTAEPGRAPDYVPTIRRGLQELLMEAADSTS